MTREDRTVALAAVAVVALHLGLVAYFAPLRVMLSNQPVTTVDYSLHVVQVDRAQRAFAESGKLWGWDPLELAGQPAGMVEDLTSKGTELFVIGLGGLGVPMGRAFNLFILSVHLGLLLAAWGSARLFGLSRGHSVLVMLSWVLLWFFDSFLHWSWWVGMISWSFACYASVLLVALLYRTLESNRRILYLPLGLLAAVLALVHPFAVFAVLVPCVALYVRAFRSMKKAEHALLWLAALFSASTVLIWIGPPLRLRHYIGDIDTFFNTTLSFLLFDTFDLMRDGRETGWPVRTLLRTICFVAAAVGLWRWRKQADRRALPLGATWLVSFAFAYLAAYLWLGRQVQPYRQIGVAMLAAAIIAVVVLSEVLSPKALKSYPRGAQIALLLAAVAIAPRFVRTVMHYIPELIPTQVVRTKLDLETSPLVGLREPRPFSMRHESALPGHAAVAEWLRKNHHGRGRIVVSEWMLGEYLVVATHLPILGGIPERNVPHVDANLFRRNPFGALPKAELERYFRDYAVGYVIVSGDHGPLDARRDLLEPMVVREGYRIYRTRAEPSYFALGSGRVVEQRLNHLKVEGASGGDVVLRFHWMETLRCRPGCQVVREPTPGDRVGFIRVPNAPPDFEIYQSYGSGT